MRAAVSGWAEMLGVLASPAPRAPHGYDFAANVMHVDEDGICPRCMAWISPEDVVRRTAFGPAQHEHCPVLALPVSR
jgi:hypothetical protein